MLGEVSTTIGSSESDRRKVQTVAVLPFVNITHWLQGAIHLSSGESGKRTTMAQ
jgi:hypothetical protein